MKKYENPKINIQLFDMKNIVTMSDPLAANYIPEFQKNTPANGVVQVSYDDIIAFNS